MATKKEYKYWGTAKKVPKPTTEKENGKIKHHYTNNPNGYTGERLVEYSAAGKTTVYYADRTLVYNYKESQNEYYHKILKAQGEKNRYKPNRAREQGNRILIPKDKLQDAIRWYEGKKAKAKRIAKETTEKKNTQIKTAIQRIPPAQRKKVKRVAFIEKVEMDDDLFYHVKIRNTDGTTKVIQTYGFEEADAANYHVKRLNDEIAKGITYSRMTLDRLNQYGYTDKEEFKMMAMEDEYSASNARDLGHNMSEAEIDADLADWGLDDIAFNWRRWGKQRKAEAWVDHQTNGYFKNVRGTAKSDYQQGVKARRKGRI